MDYHFLPSYSFHMKSILFLFCSIAPFALNASQVPPKPNIVHIMVDDLGWQDIASHKLDGKTIYETPHLDKLTRLGRRFTEAYSPSPVCAPSRVSFLRGQYPTSTGVYSVTGGQLPRPHQPKIPLIPPYYLYGLPVEEPMIPETLKKAGYFSGHVGKWHAGGKYRGFPFPTDQGFDFGFLEENGGPLFYNDKELWNPKDGRKNSFGGSWQRMIPHRLGDFATQDPNDPYQLDEDGRPFDKPTELAVGFIRKHKDKPFFLNFCPLYVHGPIATRDRKRLEYYCKKIGLDFPTDPGPINAGMHGHTNPYYAAMVDTVDWSIGKVVSYLENTDDPRNPGHKLIDNTYVIIDSDNGGWVGSQHEPITDNTPLRGGKMNNYEGGLRVPFIVRGPGVPAQTVCETPINLIDLYPTFMKMAGLKEDPSLNLDGCNVLPLMHGKTDRVIQPDGRPRETIYWFYPLESHMSVVMRKGDWKLIRNLGVGYAGKWSGVENKESVELFRIKKGGKISDLEEAKNLANEFPEIRKEMLTELNEFLRSSNVSMPYRNLGSNQVSEQERAASPKVLDLGSERDRVWITLEQGTGKVGIQDAQLIYTLNPSEFDKTKGHREEWFVKEASIGDGIVQATMPPGATHAVFCLRDANGFLITSEHLPDFQTVPYGNTADSTFLKNGFAYKPGLFSLIRLGEDALASARKKSLNTQRLETSLSEARIQYQTDKFSVVTLSDAIRSLRGEIRKLAPILQSKHFALHRFPSEPLF
jgi:arylsulfatase A-like enzyme